MSEENKPEAVNAPQEERTLEKEEENKGEEAENPFDEAGDAEKVNEDGTPTKQEEKRKSLVGLSPSQDAKVIMFKQMFQDYDEEVLCSILFEQNGGNLDASIESILKMQSADGAGGEEKKEAAEKPKEEEGSSLAEDPTSADKAGAPESEGTEKSKEDVDKETQELIDELLAED